METKLDVIVPGQEGEQGGFRHSVRFFKIREKRTKDFLICWIHVRPIT